MVLREKGENKNAAGRSRAAFLIACNFVADQAAEAVA
jgi:hypothetical protein